MADKLIFESDNFSLNAVEYPHITRTDGGHIKITPKIRYADRLDLTPELAVEMAWLTMLAGEAMTKGLRKQGIDIGLINYQDNKNWSVFKPEGPYLHIHLYGRAKDAKINEYGDACQFPHRETGFYDNFEPLNDDDIKAVQNEIKQLLKTDKYQTDRWHFSS
jgi:diadenosine tetraphosphate (Ap4A) HIT family hydrolase